LHQLRNAASQRRLGLDLGAQQIAGGDVFEAEPLRQPLTLGALTRAGWSDQQEVHC
jgi:hypothetical protein